MEIKGPRVKQCILVEMRCQPDAWGVHGQDLIQALFFQPSKASSNSERELEKDLGVDLEEE